MEGSIRRTETEIRQLASLQNNTVWEIEAEDRFGDYGITGAVILKVEPKEIFIDTFLLSCRVLGKGVEDAVLYGLKEFCREEDKNVLAAGFRPTAKNEPFLLFIERAGWEKIEETGECIKYKINIDKIPDIPDFIDFHFKSHYEKRVMENRGNQSGSQSYKLRSVSDDNEHHPNSWEVQIINEENLLHKAHLIPLQKYNGLLLLQLPKTDRNMNTGTEYIAPRTPAEDMLAGIWADVLGLEAVGVYDKFFDLGGHSLLATQVVSRIRQVFQIELSLQTLMQAPTVAELTQWIEAAQQEASGPSSPPVTPVPREGNLPLSFAQQRLWFLAQLEPENAAYNISTAVQLTGSLNTDVLLLSMNEIIARHETLRTSFPAVDGVAVQIIAPHVRLPVSEVDLRLMPEKMRDVQVSHVLTADSQRPFNVAAGPLVRVTLVRKCNNLHVLQLTMHHIISDGWSMGLLIQEFVTLYQAFSQRFPSPLPVLKVQYADVAQWQRQWLKGEVLENQLSYWRQQLAGSPVVNFLYSMQQQFTLTARDVLLAVTTLSFDIAVLELFLPLITGAQIALSHRETAKNGVQLSAYLERSGATMMQATPATWRMLLDAGWTVPQQSLSPNGSFIKGGKQEFTILCGGEAFPCELANRLVEIGAVVWNMYGPTETTIWSTMHRVTASEGAVSIGRPIGNTQVYILDAYLKPVPIGVPGDVYIGGEGLARGYFQRPALTAEKFIPDPFHSHPGARLYDTGDLARYLPDGSIEFLGRRDHQVKVRGFRIELGEIETVLAQHPDIQETVAMVREDKATTEQPGDKRLVAYLVPRDGQTIHVNEIRRFLQERLPTYMMPSMFVILDALPQTPNGKVDRQALPEPDRTRPEIEDAYVAPRTPTEEKLAKVWANVLGIEQIGSHDNSFELGGDSLLLLRSISEARKVGLNFTPQEFFRHQTIAALAALEQSSSIQATLINTTIGPQRMLSAIQGIVTGHVPLTANNAGGLILDHYFDVNYHNLAALFEVPPEIAPGLLVQIMRFLIRYHDGLRSRFECDETGWRQFIDASTDEVPFIFLDLSTLPAAKQGAVIESAANELHRSFNLSEGLLLRTALFHLGDGNPRRLLFIAHHAAVDAFSWQILLQDARDAYLQSQRGGELHFPPKTTSLKQWTERLHAYARSDEVRRELDYWLHLPWDQVVYLPVDFPGGLGGRIGTTNREIRRALSREDTRILLRTIPKFFHADIMDVVVMALVEALGKWTGGQWMHFHVQDSGRRVIPGADDLDLSRTVGNFLCRRHFVLERPDMANPGDALRSIHNQLHRIPNHGFGYSLLRYCSGDDKIAAQMASLFVQEQDLFLNYLGQESETPVNPAAGLFRPARESHGARNHPNNKIPGLGLRCDVRVNGGCLRLNWSYYTKVYRPATMERVVNYYLTALRDLIEYCRAL